MANLLIVDDELGMRQFLTHLLQREGHVVRVAENGREAMAQLREQAPDLIISDIRMPDMGGVDLLRAAKRVTAGSGSDNDDRVCQRRHRSRSVSARRLRLCSEAIRQRSAQRNSRSARSTKSHSSKRRKRCSKRTKRSFRDSGRAANSATSSGAARGCSRFTR
jgi:DNA-binding NarL/FixJ family response regulator